MKLKAKKTIALIFSNGFYTWYRVKQNFDYMTSKGLKQFHEGDVIGVRDATSQKGMARLVFKGHITNVFSIKKDEFKAIAEDKLEPVNPEKTYSSNVLAKAKRLSKAFKEYFTVEELGDCFSGGNEYWDTISNILDLLSIKGLGLADNIFEDFADGLYNKCSELSRKYVPETEAVVLDPDGDEKDYGEGYPAYTKEQAHNFYVDLAKWLNEYLDKPDVVVSQGEIFKAKRLSKAEEVDANKILNEATRVVHESMMRFMNLWNKGSKDLALSELEMNRDYFDRLYNKLKQA